jgi:hypothetical protein
VCDRTLPCGHPPFFVEPPLAGGPKPVVKSVCACKPVPHVDRVPPHPQREAKLTVPGISRATPATYRPWPIGFGVLAILLTIAQLADLTTGYLERPAGWIGIERNPLAAALMTSPVLAIAAKLALLALVVSVVAIIRVSRPRAAILVLVVGISAGVIGALSNAT